MRHSSCPVLSIHTSVARAARTCELHKRHDRCAHLVIQMINFGARLLQRFLLDPTIIGPIASLPPGASLSRSSRVSHVLRSKCRSSFSSIDGKPVARPISAPLQSRLWLLTPEAGHGLSCMYGTGRYLPISRTPALSKVHEILRRRATGLSSHLLKPSCRRALVQIRAIFQTRLRQAASTIGTKPIIDHRTTVPRCPPVRPLSRPLSLRYRYTFFFFFSRLPLPCEGY
ncbi:hypothetical protein F5B21DRAFT_310999 [Xylaria acuta]|nr:hypothetical protein F5B21DRAFT_310999 [Xylaria acuta]